MDDVVSLSGSFVPTQGGSARLTPGIAGRLAKVLVREGEHVRAGQLLATIDEKVQTSQQSSASAGSAAANSQANQAELTYKAAAQDQAMAVKAASIALDETKQETDASVTQARLGFEEGEADFAKLMAGPRPQEVEQARAATAQARAGRDRAASEYRRNQALAPDGYVSRRQIEDSKTALDTAESALLAAAAAESLVRAGARPEEIRAGRAHLASLKEALDSARMIGERKVATAEANLQQQKLHTLDVLAKQKDVEIGAAVARQKTADLSSAGATTALAEIRAPFDGTVSRRMLNPGEYADTTTPVLELVGTTGRVDFLASALPAQAALIHAGMSSSVDYDSSVVSGTVQSISAADPQTGLSLVRISCGTAAPTGVFTTAHVIVRNYPSIVAVPDQTIVSRDGKTIAYKVVDGVAKQLEVETGPENSGFTGVLSGIKAGDLLVEVGAFELTDGAKVKAAAPAKKEPGP
jgi:RND family efflux transporter MFP subunit